MLLYSFRTLSNLNGCQLSGGGSGVVPSIIASMAWADRKIANRFCELFIASPIDLQTCIYIRFLILEYASPEEFSVSELYANAKLYPTSHEDRNVLTANPKFLLPDDFPQLRRGDLQADG